MIRKILVNVGVATTLSGLALAAQAATLTFKNSNPEPFWTYGSGNAVKVASPGYNGQGGSFNATISGAPAGFNGLFAMYCVDLGQYIAPEGSYSDYSLVTSVAHFGASKALELAKLLTYSTPRVDANGDKDFASTALQLAIWNTIHDADHDLDGGPFKNRSNPGSSVANPTVNALAENYISAGASTPNSLQLFVLASPTKQDQLIWLRGGIPAQANVPEPTSLALAFGALCAMGCANRRRRSTTA
jgi:Thioester domain